MKVAILISAHPLAVAMSELTFIQTSLIGSGVVAIVAASVGYFLVLRSQTFAGHALSHIGFAGATGAVLFGLSPFWGLIGFTTVAGMAMGFLGEKLAGRDVAIGMILSLSLGFGLLFLHFYTSFASQLTALLFGNVLGIDQSTLPSLAIICAAALTLLALMSRPLLFATLQPDLAEARGVSLRLVSVLFLGLSGLAIALCTQVVGMLLVFTMLIAPAASAQNMTGRLVTGLCLSLFFALTASWGGIALAIASDWPTSFCITAVSGLIYAFSLLKR